MSRGSTRNLVDFLRSPLGTVILAVMLDAVICCAILLPLFFFPLFRRESALLYYSAWRGIRDFLFVAGWPFRASPLALHK